MFSHFSPQDEPHPPKYSVCFSVNDQMFSVVRRSASRLSQSTSRYLVAFKHMAVVNNCRLFDYQDGVKRFPVPEERVSWSVNWPDYQPVDHTHPAVLRGPVWADLDFRCVPINTI